MVKGLDDSKEFLVIDFIIYLSRAKGGEIVSDGTEFLWVGRVLLP